MPKESTKRFKSGCFWERKMRRTCFCLTLRIYMIQIFKKTEKKRRKRERGKKKGKEDIRRKRRERKKKEQQSYISQGERGGGGRPGSTRALQPFPQTATDARHHGVRGCFQPRGHGRRRWCMGGRRRWEIGIRVGEKRSSPRGPLKL